MALFINLTNHPSFMWDDNQKSEALKYGEINDLSFPNVSPSCTEDEVEALATECINQIKLLAAFQLPIVHVMGEMTLTYAIVNQLKSMGVTCVASTSERIVKELPNGSKVSTFRFVKFRKY